MAIYAFTLGRKYLLSVAELCQVLPPESKIIDISHDALIAELSEKLADPQQTLNYLGGSIKIVEIKQEMTKDPNLLPENIAKVCLDYFKDIQKKFSYGVSIYSFKKPYEKILKKTLNHSKNALKEANLKSRYINKDFQNLSNAALKGEKILEEGAEFVAIRGKDKIFIGITVAVQDFEEYSRRDYERPERDPRLGMLPPKLAQMMINLTSLRQLNSAKEQQTALTVYDPFCGIGTVLNEALLMGFNVIGSDLQPEIAQKAQINLEWIKKGSTIKQKSRIFAHDAQTLESKDFPENISAIVSETYLGPPMSHLPDLDQIDHIFGQIENTIVNFLKSIKKIIPPKTPLVISLLTYRDKKGYITMDNLIDKIKKMGFTPQPLIPEKIRSEFNLPVFRDESLIYDREDQIVARGIWKLTYKDASI